MSERKHTTGPWKAEVEESGDNLSVYGADGTLVVGGCGCCGSPYVDPERGKYDALLIAAAPDMLEALKAAIANSDANLGTKRRTPEAQAVYDQVDAAIAKAEGRS